MITVSSQIIDVIDAMCDKFGIVVDWTSENVVPYLQQLAEKYIRYEIATSWAWIIGTFFLMVLALVAAIILGKCDADHGIVAFMYVVMAMFACIFLAVTAEQISDIICCKYFPEKQIVEYARQLIASYSR